MTDAFSYPTCSDLSDAKPLYKKAGLFLKPLVKINISVQLPKSKSLEYSISNHALMEAVKELARPDKFCSLKTTKTAVDLVRFEAEVEIPRNVKWIISRIDGQNVKLQGNSESAKVRANTAKNDFPSRHDWDSFFRDAKHMNELKAGERPDTMHIQDLPVDWFSTKASDGKPCEKLICKIFEQFGPLSAVDVPSNDPYRSQMKAHLSGMKQFNFRTTKLFETYVQYKDYLSFVSAMVSFRDMKLLKKDDNGACTQVIKVDFDKTKHLCESSIRKRKLLREKLMEKERQSEEKCQEVVENVVQCKAATDSRQKKNSPDQNDKNQNDVSMKKILREEKLFLVAQRKLESIRLLSELLQRVASKKSNHDETSRVKHTKKKSTVSVIKQVNNDCSTYEDNNVRERLSFSSSSSRDYTYRGRGNFSRGRGFRFPSRRGRGRFMRGNSYRNNLWEGNRTYQRNSNAYDRYFDKSYDNRRDYERDQYDDSVHHMYFRYFQSLTRDKTNIDEGSEPRSRSSSRTKHRSESPSPRHRRRSRTRSRSHSRKLTSKCQKLPTASRRSKSWSSRERSKSRSRSWSQRQSSSSRSRSPSKSRKNKSRSKKSK